MNCPACNTILTNVSINAAYCKHTVGKYRVYYTMGGNTMVWTGGLGQYHDSECVLSMNKFVVFPDENRIDMMVLLK
jgi:hypothetical protein